MDCGLALQVVLNTVSRYGFRYIVEFIFLARLRFPSRLSIVEVLRKRYGDQALKLNRKFEKTDIKHKKTLLDLQFLKICEDHNVIPTFLRLKLQEKK